METHVTTLQNGSRAVVTIIYKAHSVAVHLGTGTATGRYVLTDLTVDRTLADANGQLLTFATPCEAACALGAYLVSRYGLSLANALKAVQS